MFSYGFQSLIIDICCIVCSELPSCRQVLKALVLQDVPGFGDENVKQDIVSAEKSEKGERAVENIICLHLYTSLHLWVRFFRTIWGPYNIFFLQELFSSDFARWINIAPRIEIFRRRVGPKEGGAAIGLFQMSL